VSSIKETAPDKEYSDKTVKLQMNLFRLSKPLNSLEFQLKRSKSGILNRSRFRISSIVLESTKLLKSPIIVSV
jgi:hypothetical protein